MDLQALAVAAGIAGWMPAPVRAPKAAPAPSATPAAVVVVASPSGATVDWDKFAGGLMASRVIAVGEKHDEPSHHAVQAKVLAAVAEHDSSVVVGLEMVSQDQQSFLDDFRAGQLSEAEFSDWWKKTWGFDYSIYKPIFDAARAKNLRIVGLNAPIGLVKIVAKQGLAGLTPQQRATLPSSIEESADVRYRDFVKDSLSGHGLPPEAMARMIQAQAVWNEAMGAKVAELAASSRVIVIAGQGHMLWRAGIPESAARRGAGPATVVLPYPLDGEVVPIPDQLKRLRDPAGGELVMADSFVLIP
ncbi:MAG TPA: ChaN family lipoprotein [Elusimicrobiota bacterium]|nr:ChaN family lipoprotein [Elusimicrobiota bacterium]